MTVPNPDAGDPWNVHIRHTDELQHIAMLFKREGARTAEDREQLAAIIAELERRNAST